MSTQDSSYLSAVAIPGGALSVYHQKSGHALPVDDWGSLRSGLHTAPNLWVNLGRSAFCSKRTKVGSARGLVTFKWPGYGIEEPCKALWTLFLACLAHASGPPMVNRSRETIRDNYLNDSDEVLGFVAKLLIASNLNSIYLQPVGLFVLSALSGAKSLGLGVTGDLGLNW